MNFIECVVRVMTHINMVAALGLAAWVLWSGWQVVTGQVTPGYRVAEAMALMSLTQAVEPAPVHLVPVRAGAGALPACNTAAPAPQRSAVVLTGGDV